MMEFTERMLEKVALALHGTTTVQIDGREISFKAPFRRLTMTDAIREKTGYDITGQSEEQLHEACKRLEVEIDDTMGKGKLIDAIFGQYCEEELIQPTFIMDYPCEMSPPVQAPSVESRPHGRFELFVNRKELCNAYSELNDPIDQLERFQEQLRLSEKGATTRLCSSIWTSSAPSEIRYADLFGPMGIGIDRLTMFTDGQQFDPGTCSSSRKCAPEKKAVNDPAEKYTALGIPEEWVPVIQKMGYLTADSLKKLSPGKFFNDLCGFNKRTNWGWKALRWKRLKNGANRGKLRKVMTSGRNIWLAGICAASVLAAGLRLGDIVPGWVFRTLCTLALGTIWLRLGQQVWHRLRQRQRPWFLFGTMHFPCWSPSRRWPASPTTSFLWTSDFWPLLRPEQFSPASIV